MGVHLYVLSIAARLSDSQIWIKLTALGAMVHGVNMASLSGGKADFADLQCSKLQKSDNVAKCRHIYGMLSYIPIL